MKLYTEEKIREMLDFFQVRDEDINIFIDKIEPIEIVISNNKNTAVQWLVNNIAEGYNKKGSLPFSDILILVYKALEIEKQQIVKAVNDYSFSGSKAIQAVLKKYNLKTAGEKYYHEHYEG